MKISIHEANDEQLRQFATETLALDADVLAMSATRAALLSVIEPAWPNDFITIADAPPPPAQTGQAAPVVPVPDQVLMAHLTEEFGPLTQFRIISTNMPGGNHPAHPCVNGRQLVMQRNMLIHAPYAYYLALRNANVGEPYEVENGPGKAPTVYFSDVTNYPLTDVILPSQSEIDEWHARRGPIPLAA